MANIVREYKNTENQITSASINSLITIHIKDIIERGVCIDLLEQKLGNY